MLSRRGSLKLNVLQSYKRYAHAFFAFVILYFSLNVYALNIAGLGLFSILGSNEFVLAFFLLFFVVNKFRQYLRQVRKNNFNFMFIESYVQPSKKILFICILKSIISILVYVIFNTMALQLILQQLEDTQSSSFIVTVLKAFYIIFPVVIIAWEIKRYLYWPSIRKEKIAANRVAHTKYADTMHKTVNAEKPKDHGEITGYEPKKLGSLLLQSSPLMKGEPAIGLSGSSFDAYNKKAGAMGEINFAKALQLNNYLDKFATYWSVQIPSVHGPGAEVGSEVDIDCILISKQSIHLIDVKFYSQGNVTWETTEDGKSIYSINNLTGNFATPPKRMSKNMTLAEQKIKKKMASLGIKMNVISHVVMVPTDYGIGKVENIYWPGKIKCISVVEFLNILQKEEPINIKTEDAKLLDNVFTWLVKDETGKAPKSTNF